MFLYSRQLDSKDKTMEKNLTLAQRAAADRAFDSYDFLDARVEGQQPWNSGSVRASEDQQRPASYAARIVFLSPVEAEDGVEMVNFEVRFKEAGSAEVEEVSCTASTGNRFGQPGLDSLAAMHEMTRQAQANRLYG